MCNITSHAEAAVNCEKTHIIYISTESCSVEPNVLAFKSSNVTFHWLHLFFIRVHTVGIVPEHKLFPIFQFNV